MSKVPCSKRKRPCKVCLETVKPKNGLQCYGECQSWMHYKCANFTPGKIKDIKKGIIKVNCPCLDCSSKLPKEYRTDETSCANTQCPSNRPVSCQNKGCPSYQEDTTCPAQWPVDKCGSLCKKYPADGCDKRNRGPSSGNPIPQNIKGPPQPMPTLASSGLLNPAVGDTYMSSGTIGANDFSYKALEQMCSTVGLLSKQLTELLCKMKASIKQRGSCLLTSDPAPTSDLSPPPSPPTPSPPKSAARCPKICKCPKTPRAAR